MKKEELDLFKKVEELTDTVNKFFGKKGEPIFNRYPLIFAFLVIFGAIMISKGIEESLLKVSLFKNDPMVMTFIGMTILIITGTLYKKLDK